jgi:DNA-directed RNA polymerase specialized sigma24 family protein
MASTAIAFRPTLLLRARELCGRRADVDAEDLVATALLALVAKPPSPRTPGELNHWLRTVLRNQAALAHRNLHGATVVSLEAMQEARAQGASD